MPLLVRFHSLCFVRFARVQFIIACRHFRPEYLFVRKRKTLGIFMFHFVHEIRKAKIKKKNSKHHRKQKRILNIQKPRSIAFISSLMYIYSSSRYKAVEHFVFDAFVACRRFWCSHISDCFSSEGVKWNEKMKNLSFHDNWTCLDVLKSVLNLFAFFLMCLRIFSHFHLEIFFNYFPRFQCPSSAPKTRQAQKK